jgi:CheY-specific phosphatase CheX
LDDLLEPFITAVQAALGEMTGTEIAVRGLRPQPVSDSPEDIAVVLELQPASRGTVILHFPAGTAGALAGRILSGAEDSPDRTLIEDCMGEIANVVAGQAKALLAGTPRQFSFALPRVGGGGPVESRPGIGNVHSAVFICELGEFGLELLIDG